MEASAKHLKDRVSALLAGAKKYRDGISAMHEAQLAFAAALTEFGGGSDEESLHLGGCGPRGGEQGRGAVASLAWGWRAAAHAAMRGSAVCKCGQRGLH